MNITICRPGQPQGRGPGEGQERSGPAGAAGPGRGGRKALGLPGEWLPLDCTATRGGEG